VFQPNGISLHVEDHGSGKPMVLLHGCSPSWAFFESNPDPHF
jgi:hypothetical protein